MVVPTMSYMRHPLLALLLAACSEAPDPGPPPCPTSSSRNPLAECEARCKTGDDSAEVCGVDLERACVDECVRCAPDVAWCPRD